MGDGVFETVKVAGGVPFAMSRHLARLGRSAAGLGLPELDLEAIRAGAGALLEASGRPQQARLRITVTGGLSNLGSERTGSAPKTASIGASTAGTSSGSVEGRNLRRCGGISCW